MTNVSAETMIRPLNLSEQQTGARRKRQARLSYKKGRKG
jgi:hypothetical protein